jgi:Zn-finger nucleic acid-binding protein
MVAFQLEGVEIDHCMRCRGTWLDAGELETLCRLAGSPAGGLSAALSATRDGRRGPRRCPRCPRRLRSIRVGASPPVQLDRCRQGHGLWFDQGEMEEVMAAFSSGEEGVVAGFFAELFRHERRSRLTGD